MSVSGSLNDYYCLEIAMTIKELYYFDRFGRKTGFVTRTEKEFRELKLNLLEQTLTKAIDVVYYLDMSTGITKQLDYYND